MTTTQRGPDGPAPEREPTLKEWGHIFESALSDSQYDSHGMPAILRDTIARQIQGASTARLALMKASAPFETLLSEDSLTGELILNENGARRELPFVIRRVAAKSDRFIVRLEGLADGFEPLALLIGNLRLATPGSSPMFDEPVAVPMAWLPPTVDWKSMPAEEPTRPERRDPRKGRPILLEAAFDSGERNPRSSQVDVCFLESDDTTVVRRLEVTAPVDDGRDEDVLVAEVEWPCVKSIVRKETLVVPLKRNPRWPQRVQRRQGAVDVHVPVDVAAGDARITIRRAAPHDFPEQLQAVFGERSDLTPLPLIVDEGQPVFRVRYEDERAALVAAGRNALLEIAFDKEDVA